MNEFVYVKDVLNEITWVFIVIFMVLIAFALSEHHYRKQNEYPLANPELKKAIKHYQNRSSNLFGCVYLWIASLIVYFLFLSSNEPIRFIPIALAAIWSLCSAYSSRK